MGEKVIYKHIRGGIRISSVTVMLVGSKKPKCSSIEVSGFAEGPLGKAAFKDGRAVLPFQRSRVLDGMSRLDVKVLASKYILKTKVVENQWFPVTELAERVTSAEKIGIVMQDYVLFDDNHINITARMSIGDFQVVAKTSEPMNFGRGRILAETA